MPMKIITIAIPDAYLDCIEILVNMGFFPNRSEVCRQAIKDALAHETEFNKGIQSETFSTMKRIQMEKMLH